MLLGSIAPDKAYHAGQVKGDDPDEMGYPGPPGWGLCLRIPNSPHKKVHVEKTSEMPQGEVKNRRQSGYKVRDDFGTWNIQTLFQTGALMSSLSQQNQYMLDITA